MASGFIVWDSKAKQVVSGPHPTSPIATAAMRRATVHQDAGKTPTASYSVVTVTV